jgi:hypothetical protein
MKKIVLTMLLALMFANVYSQTASVTINNHTSCDYRVVLYAKSGIIGAYGCPGMVISNAFTVTASTTFSSSDPCSFESSVGWSYLPTGYTSICGSYTGCTGFTYPCDWHWSYADIDYPGCACGVAGRVGNGACGSVNPLTECSLTGYAAWSYSSTSPMDLTLDIYP